MTDPATTKRALFLEQYASKAERRTCVALIDAILKRGYNVRIMDEKEWACEMTRDREVLLDSMASTGFDFVCVYEEQNTLERLVMRFDVIYQKATSRDEVIYDYSGGKEADAVYAEACGLLPPK